MKKIALVFIIAVLAPSLVLAWLALRSLRHQQFLLEKQQSLLCQGISDAAARSIQDAFAEQQQVFNARLAALLRDSSPSEIARDFDDRIRRDWALAEVGFVVTLAGEILAPSSGRPEGRRFLDYNSLFLANRESAEVYLNAKQAWLNNPPGPGRTGELAQSTFDGRLTNPFSPQNRNQVRNVVPQQQLAVAPQMQATEETQQQYSRLASSEAEFRQLIGNEIDGTLARFVDNRLSVLFWHRPPQHPEVVFGAQLSLIRLEQELRPLIENTATSFRQEFCLALLDDTAKPVAVSDPGFRTTWRRPFVATEIGEMLPHWETAVYLLDPAKLNKAAENIKLTLGLLIAVMVLAIGVGSWLIAADLNRQLAVARQKTDFVSNVSHELKTPLTSIRMFSELLAEGAVSDPAKQRSYLAIIAAETARLTRLINNVLDFARIERGEKKYNFQWCNLTAIARETAEICRPNLESNGFDFIADLPLAPVMVKGDRDALAQIILNLLSNAEKYTDSNKEIVLRLSTLATPPPRAELSVLDRGLGVPKGTEQRIFEKFYRAHDSLSSGIQGSGLGLTLARQIARAHGGDVAYEPRSGGGSCFSLMLPLSAGEMSEEA